MKPDTDKRDTLIEDSDYSEDLLEKKLNDNEKVLTNKDSLIIVSFRMPVKVKRKPDGSFKIEDSQSQVYPTIFNLKDRGLLNFTWVGWPGIIPNNEDEKARVKNLLAAHRCHPVWFTFEQVVLFQIFFD